MKMRRESYGIWAAAIAVAVVSSIGCSGGDAQRPLAAARAHLQNSNEKSATIELKNALQIEPELAEARFLLGSILLKQGNPAAAEIELRKALAGRYPAQQVVPELALAMLQQDQPKKLLDEFASVQLDQTQADASLQTSLAAAYARLGKTEQARVALAAALQAVPGHPPARLLEARQLASANNIDAALAIVDELLAQNAGSADAWMLKGDLLWLGRAKTEEAKAAYRKSLEAKPGFLPAHHARLNVLLQRNELDEAAAALQDLKRAAPNDLQGKYFEARLAAQLDDNIRALELLAPLLAAAPRNPQVLELAGLIELQMGNLRRAETHLAAALQVAPTAALARQGLVATRLRSGQPAMAIAALTDGSSQGVVSESLYGLAGQAYLQSGDAKKAEEYFAKALQRDPDNADKRTALAMAWLSGDATDKGLNELQRIAATDAGVSADLALISAHMARDDHKKALAATERLEAKQPGQPLAPLLRGRIYLAQKDTNGARKSFERALEIEPGYFAAAAALAALDSAEGNPAAAKKRLEEQLARNPRNGQALLGLTELAAARGATVEEMSGLLNRAVEAAPDDATPRLLLINLYLRAGDRKQAAAAAQKGVAALPDNADMLDALGRVQLESGETNQAIATFQKLTAMQPRQPMPHLRLAAAYKVQNNPRAAENSVRKALEFAPGDAQVSRALVGLLIEQGKFGDALETARAQRVQKPSSPSGYALEGDVHVSQGNWLAAVAILRSGLQVAPSTDLASKLNMVLQAAGKPEDAEREAAAWMRAHPKDARYLGHLGENALARRDYALAERRYLQVLQLQPDNAAALNNLAWSMYRQDKPGGLLHAQRAHELAPGQTAFMDTLAMLLSRDGQHEKAVQMQAKALALEPGNAGLRLNAARIYLAAGDKARARAQLDAVIQLGESHPLHAESQALMKSL